jgi:RimJ/RimL family protein N-acetyltransferase
MAFDPNADFPRLIPTLDCQRLILRHFTLDDAPRVEQLLDTPEIAAPTLYISYSSPPGAAESWIRSLAPAAAAGEEFTWAITLRDTGEVIGSFGLHSVLAHKRGSVGYWVGVPYWNQGYMTEALKRVIAFAFTEPGFLRVEALHFASNPSSGRVMEQAGMDSEGTLRACYLKAGQPIDVVMWSINQHHRVQAREGSSSRCGSPAPAPHHHPTADPAGVGGHVPTAACRSVTRCGRR